MNTSQVVIIYIVYALLFAVPIYTFYKYIEGKFYKDKKDKIVLPIMFFTNTLLYFILSIPYFRSSVVLINNTSFYEILQNVVINLFSYLAFYLLLFFIIFYFLRNLISNYTLKINYIKIIITLLISFSIIYFSTKSFFKFYNNKLETRNTQNINI